MATQLGMTVPDDVAVVGFDDIDMAAWPAFQLTTVHNPLLEMARHAATLLVNLVEERNSEVTREIYPTDVVVRQTHG